MSKLKLLEIHLVPIWKEDNGSVSYGMEQRDNHPPVIGWANVFLAEVYGDRRYFLAVDFPLQTDDLPEPP